MFLFNKISTLFLFSAGLMLCVFYTTPATALGKKAVKDASYYLHDLNDPKTPQKEGIEKILPKIILIKCGNPDKNPTGIAVMETGEIYGFDDFRPLKLVDFSNQTLLKTDKTATDPLFAYADQIGLENINFKKFEPDMDMCVIEYQKNNKYTFTRWAKHPYLREMNPPPAELLTLFEAVQNVIAAPQTGNEKTMPVQE